MTILEIGLMLAGSIIIVIITLPIHSNMRYAPIYARGRNIFRGEYYEALEETEYIIHKTNGSLLEYFFDSQGGRYLEVNDEETAILKTQLVEEDGRYILNRK